MKGFLTLNKISPLLNVLMKLLCDSYYSSSHDHILSLFAHLVLNYNESIPTIMDHEAMKVVLDKVKAVKAYKYTGAMGTVINIIVTDDMAARLITNLSVLQSLKEMMKSDKLEDKDYNAALSALEAIFNNDQIDVKLLLSVDIIQTIVSFAKKCDDDDPLKIKALECISAIVNRGNDNEEYIQYMKARIKVIDILRLIQSEKMKTLIKSQIDLNKKLDMCVEKIL